MKINLKDPALFRGTDFLYISWPPYGCVIMQNLIIINCICLNFLSESIFGCLLISYHYAFL